MNAKPTTGLFVAKSLPLTDDGLSKITANPERLSDLNTKVRSTCVDNDVVFVDNDVNFTFSKGGFILLTQSSAA